MALIAGTQVTLTSGSPSVSFAPTGTAFAVNVITPGAQVRLTKMVGADATTEVPCVGGGAVPQLMTGPASYMVIAIAGDTYKLTTTGASCAVACSQ